ncbi:MAG: hypothetical protein HDS82_02160 [Bacteroidales bacterium]|nr:hypothetical protein [Bacteroidales bacterium]
MLSNLDHKRFWPSFIILVIVCAVLFWNIDAVQAQVNTLYNGVINGFGWLFIVVDTLCLVVSLYFIFGRYRNVRLGGPDARPEYSTFSWAAMIFTSSCGAWLLVYGFLEPIYILKDPPFQIEPLSPQAFEYAQTYAHFHWGPSAWALYVPVTVAIGYQLYNLKATNNRLSLAVSPVLRNTERSAVSLFIDLIAIFGAIISPVISIGTGMPVITVMIQDFFGFSPDNATAIQVGVLIIWAIIFTLSVFLGMRRGIRIFSNANAILGFIFMIAVGIAAGVVYILEAETNVGGLLLSQFLRMQTYTDPYGGGQFVKGWTASYWGCYMVYMALMGVFNAKISRGRTLRQVAVGQLVLCSLGCWVAMTTLGNYALELQQTGVADIAGILDKGGEAAAMLEIVHHLPASKFFMGAIVVLCIIFLCTTMDSSTIAVAEMTTRNGGSKGATRVTRLIWAAIACVLTFILLSVGGYKSVRLMCLLMGLPLGILAIFIVWSAIVLLRKNESQES